MKTVVLYSIIGASALAVGVSGGVIYKRCIAAPTENIIGFNPDGCKPNAEELFKAVQKAGSIKAAVDKLQPYEIVNYSFEKYKQNEKSVSFCVGLADTAVQQYVRSAQIRNGSQYFEEQISKSSMVGVAKRMFQDGEEKDVKVYHETGSGDVICDNNEAYSSYKSDPQVFSYKDYKTAWGRNLPDMTIYLIASSTIADQSITKEDGGYKVVLNLNPVKGAYNYRYQMKTISNLATEPTFSLLDLTYWLDEDLNIIKMNERSAFVATMVGISAPVDNNLDYYYFAGKEMKFPELNEKFDYKTLLEEATK